jgi:hypothetical protein
MTDKKLSGTAEEVFGARNVTFIAFTSNGEAYQITDAHIHQAVGHKIGPAVWASVETLMKLYGVPWSTRVEGSGDANMIMFKGECHTEWSEPLSNVKVVDGKIVSATRGEDARLREALEEMCAAAEYWAGCDEGCSPDEASSEIMSSGGAMPSLAYDRARAALQGDAAHTSQEKGNG